MLPFLKDCQREITPGYIYKRQDDNVHVILTDQFWNDGKIITPKYSDKSDVCKYKLFYHFTGIGISLFFVVRYFLKKYLCTFINAGGLRGRSPLEKF